MYLRKSNSTTTCFIPNTMFEPDRNEMIFSTCVAFLSHIRAGMEKGLRFSGPDIFNEELFPLESTRTKRYRKAVTDPDVEVLYSFVTKIVDRVDLEETTIVLSLAFVERVMVFRQFDLLPSNWRRMIMTGFLVAAKTFYDEVVWNADFVASFPNYDLASSLHQMEMCLLEMIDFNVIVRQSLYAKYYFELRSISEEQNYNTLKKKYREEKAKQKLESASGSSMAKTSAIDQAGSLITTGGKFADLSLGGNGGSGSNRGLGKEGGGKQQNGSATSSGKRKGSLQ